MKLLQYEKVLKNTVFRVSLQNYLKNEYSYVYIIFFFFCLFWATKNFLPMVPRYVNAI